jgi:hypothetical protein
MSIKAADPQSFYPDDPTTWGPLRPTIIAHDVGGFRDRSTAVVGGNRPFGPPMLGILECHELPQGLCGSPRASALAAIDARFDRNALIVADLSNDRSYAEALLETFGVRVIGLQISRFGDGMDFERRPVGNGVMLIYTVGRSYLFESLHAELQSDLVRFIDGAAARHAYAQLAALETEMRETGLVYRCAPGQHDDLAISVAMLAWAARHPHLRAWFDRARASCQPRRSPPRISSLAWT